LLPADGYRDDDDDDDDDTTTKTMMMMTTTTTTMTRTSGMQYMMCPMQRLPKII